jgi:hypothetical protein
VEPPAVLDAVEKRKISFFCRELNPDHPSELFRLIKYTTYTEKRF